MNFFEAIKTRRSIRKYTEEAIPEDVIQKAVQAAFLAPNSSNMQTWRIYRVKDATKKHRLIQYCFNQSAARTAKELFVFTADASLWPKSQKFLMGALPANSPKAVRDYYGKLMPLLYGWRILAPIKWLTFQVVGLSRPFMKRPWSARDVDEVCIKSTALAAENFMLAMAAQGYGTCPMEGFDESRVKNLLNMSFRGRVVMVVSAGKPAADGIFMEQVRMPLSETYYEL